MKEIYKTRSLFMGYTSAEEESWRKKKKWWQCPWVDFPFRMKISFKSKFKQRWDLLIGALAVYNSLIIPFEHSFQPLFLREGIFNAINYIIDVCFLIDIFLMFLTSVIGQNGTESFDSKDISDNYLWSLKFYIDFASVLGSEVFRNISSLMNNFGLFKLLRIFRISALIRNSNAAKSTKVKLTLVKLCFFLFLYLHCVGCYLWIVVGFNQGKRYIGMPTQDHYVARDGEILLDETGSVVKYNERYYMRFGPQATFKDDSWNRFTPENAGDILGWRKYNERWDSRNRIWMTPIDFVNPADHGLGFTSDKYTVLFRYVTMLYYGVLIMNQSEYGPVNIEEYVYITIFDLLTLVLMAIVFGDITSLIAANDYKLVKIQQSLDRANKVMTYIALIESSQAEVREYLLKTQNTQESQKEINTFFNLISPSLKLKVQEAIFKTNLEINPVINLILLRYKYNSIKLEKKFGLRKKRVRPVSDPF